ncbi:MAG: T9SS type A sorting domain-containing protein [Elusimicrobiota bacterium]
MTRAYKTAVFALVALVAAAGFYGYAPALLTSPDYRILVGELPSVGNTTAKTGGPYSLYGNTSQVASSAITGGRYSVTSGALNAVRPAQPDVSAAHVFPNPCNARYGCNGVTFTRLTLNATIFIYTVSGELVRRIDKAGNIDSTGWDLRNESGVRVASGLYIFFVKAESSSRKGKIVIIR